MVRRGKVKPEDFCRQLANCEAVFNGRRQGVFIIGNADWAGGGQRFKCEWGKDGGYMWKEWGWRYALGLDTW